MVVVIPVRRMAPVNSQERERMNRRRLAVTLGLEVLRPLLSASKTDGKTFCWNLLYHDRIIISSNNGNNGSN